MSDYFPIQGDGFILREPQTVDARSLADIEFDPNVKHYLNLPSLTKEKWIETFDPRAFAAVCVEVQSNVAGRASINRYRQGRKGYAELAVVIGRLLGLHQLDDLRGNQHRDLAAGGATCGLRVLALLLPR